MRHRRQAVERRDGAAVRRPAGVPHPGQRRGSYLKAGTAATGSSGVLNPEERHAVPDRDRRRIRHHRHLLGSQTDFAAGDVLKIVAPATADATLADIAITLAATLL